MKRMQPNHCHFLFALRCLVIAVFSRFFLITLMDRDRPKKWKYEDIMQ